MRLDHIAYRVADRTKTAKFFCDAFGYAIQKEFTITFPDKSTAKCIALQPPERPIFTNAPWSTVLTETVRIPYHMAPEIFVSDGSDDSIVGKWVDARNGVGGIHHLAYQVTDVQQIMKEWQSHGYAEFLSEDPLKCDKDPALTQVFTKPSELTGVIYEFITRGSFGFCEHNVQDLMLSTKYVR